MMGSRRWLSLCFVLLCPVWSTSGVSSDATGLPAIDTPAITVKAPDRIFLETMVLAGKRLIAAGEHGVIAFSDDDGASWTQARVPVDVTLTALAFPTPQTGWAVGHYGVVLHTDNAGRTWTTQLNGLQLPGLITQAAKAAVAAGSTAPAAGGALHRADVFTQQGPDKPFLTVLALTDQQAIAFGAFRLAFKTVDGGKTWQDWSLHIDDPVSHHIYAATKSGPQIYLAGEAGLVFVSNDGGNEFKPLTSPSDATMFGIIPVTGGLLTFGVAGVAYRSTDNGVSWVAEKIGDGGNLIAALKLQSGDIMIAAESGGLFISHDQGVSFTSAGPGLPMLIAGLAQAANGGILVVGNRGVIRLSPSGHRPS